MWFMQGQYYDLCYEWKYHTKMIKNAIFSPFSQMGGEGVITAPLPQDTYATNQTN